MQTTRVFDLGCTRVGPPSLISIFIQPYWLKWVSCARQWIMVLRQVKRSFPCLWPYQWHSGGAIAAKYFVASAEGSVAAALRRCPSSVAGGKSSPEYCNLTIAADHLTPNWSNCGLARLMAKWYCPCT